VTAFRLRRKESEAEGIRRVAHERAGHAARLLRDEDADPADAVHGARKDLKKLRSTLRLVRPLLGDTIYRRENKRFRNAGRALSDARDAQVRAATIDALAEHFDDEPPPGGWWAVRSELGADPPGEASLDSLRERTAGEIERGDREIDAWPLDGEGFELLRPGLKRAYSRTRKSYRQAHRHPNDETLHEFRKRSKDLWYHLRLVRRAWPAVIEATAGEAQDLSDLLGDDHDLVVFTEYLDEADTPLTSEQRSRILRLIAVRREELQEKAFAHGERLLAEKPKRFTGRIGRYWEAGGS
jgi:CHAD domain-containing protein